MKVVELRTYRVKPGLMDAWLQAFRDEVQAINEIKGARVLGSFVSPEDPDVFVWLRAFASEEDRQRVRNAIYQGPEWLAIQDRIRGMLAERNERILSPTAFSAALGS